MKKSKKAPIRGRSAFGFVSALFAGSSFAGGIVADGHTATTVSYDSNGRANITIATPVSGVSYNGYSDFNVTKAGAALQNTGVNARTIVNEVTSSNPSLIQGAISVVGPRANVILANPNGITVDGGSFVNTGHVVLSTGSVSFNDFYSAPGVLQRDVILHTSKGTLLVASGGLTGAMLSLDLIARQLQIAGPVTNTFTSSTATTQLAGGSSTAEVNTAISATDNFSGYVTYGSTTPTAAPGEELVDITPLGSLTSGRVEILVTDKGAGVHMAGKALASVGDFALQVDGTVRVDGGSVSAAGNLVMQAGAVTANVASSGSIPVLAANGSVYLTAPVLNLTGATLSAGVRDNNGNATQQGDIGLGVATGATTGDITLAQTTTSATGGLGLNGDHVDIGSSTIAADQNIALQANAFNLHTDLANGALVPTTVKSVNGLAGITTTGALAVNGATVQGAAGVQLQGGDVTIASVRQTGLVSRGDVTSAGQSVQLGATRTITLSGSDVLAAGNVVANATDIVTQDDGTDGATLVAHGGAVRMTATHDIQNTGSLIQGHTRDTADATSTGAVQLSAGHDVVNQSVDDRRLGILFADTDDLNVNATHDIDNIAGRVISNGAMNLVAGNTIDNHVVHLAGNQDGQSISYDHVHNLFGLRHGSSGIDIDFGSLSIPDQLADLVADKGMTLSASTLNNTGGQILVNSGNLKATITNDINNTAVRIGQVSLHESCSWFTCRTTASSTQQSVGGLISVSGDLTMSAGQSITNTGGRLLALGSSNLAAPQVVGRALTGYTVLSLDGGGKGWFGDSWSQIYAADGGGSFTATGGTLAIHGELLLDGGTAVGAQGMTASDGTVVIRSPQRDPVTLSHHIGFTSWLWH